MLGSSEYGMGFVFCGLTKLAKLIVNVALELAVSFLASVPNGILMVMSLLLSVYQKYGVTTSS
jgi:hypothetical protein